MLATSWQSEHGVVGINCFFSCWHIVGVLMIFLYSGFGLSWYFICMDITFVIGTKAVQSFGNYVVLFPWIGCVWLSYALSHQSLLLSGGLI